MKQERREAVEKYLSDKIGLEDLKGRIGYEDAEAVRESREQLSQAEDLAEELSNL